MTPQELKNSILQLAIQGKLVEQRPEEGTGEDLYKQIQAEKVRLIKEGKIKKEKPLPPISEDEIPFEIPDSWKWCRLNQIIQIESGKGITSSQMQNGSYPVYGGNGITGFHNQAFVKKSTIIIGRVGYYCGSVHITEDESWVTDNAFITTYPEQYVDLHYLVYILRHMKLGKDNNATAQPVVSGKKIYPLLFPLPPLAEQKRIVAKIEKLLPLVEQYEKAYNRLEQLDKQFPDDMKKSILQLAIQGKLVPQNPCDSPIKLSDNKKTDELDFDLPDNWVSAHMECITDIIPSKQYQILESQVLKEGKYAVISQSKDYSIGYSNSEAKVFHHNNPVIIFGDHTAEVKFVVFDFIVGADGVKIFEPKNCLYPKFFFYVMQFQCINLFKIGGYSRHYKFIKNKPIALPPFDEQKRIVAKIEELLPLCDLLNRKWA